MVKSAQACGFRPIRGRGTKINRRLSDMSNPPKISFKAQPCLKIPALEKDV
jgi:hypothetical protein